VSARAERIVRTAGLVTVTLVVVLAARTLAYALQTGLSADGHELASATGGPSVWLIAAATLATATAVAVAVVWLASLAVTERQRLEPAAVTASRRISIAAVAGHAVLLFLASSAAFALLESYIHWRAGLGWHGLHCLIGPVHRDALPILAALSLVTAAVLRACAHLIAWMRRIIRRLGGRSHTIARPPAEQRPELRAGPKRSLHGHRFEARGPPRRSLSSCGRLGRPAQQTKGKTTPMTHSLRPRRLPILALSTVGALIAVAGASAHAIVSPPVAKAKTLQQFTLSVPTEKENARTTQIELTVPAGFAIDSFEPAPAGWKQEVQSTGSGESAVVQKVTWTGGSVPTGEDSVFRFNAGTDATKTYTFDVRQTYSDGTVVDWSGSETSDNPAPTVESLSSFGGSSGTSTLGIIAVVLGGIALIIAIVALISGRGRSLA